MSEEQMDTVTFTSECLRTNRPCIFRDLAKEWPATTNWRYEFDQGEYISNLLKDTKIKSFTKTTAQMPGIPSRSYSFAQENNKNMTYEEFLESHRARPKEVSVEDSSPEM